ncbi:MAG TPA: endopeptidase La, partial [Deltaproteobacteria bacterium]|nr:endopeptidase La [Deltaproteobacteria bacterium]
MALEYKDRDNILPLIPLRDIIIFPSMVVPLFVGRDKSIKALDEAMSGEKTIFLAAQKQAKTDNPTPDDIYKVGTIGTVLQLLKLPDGTVKVLIEGRKRAKIREFVEEEELFLVDIEELEDEPYDKDVEVEALIRSVIKGFEDYVKLNKKVPPELLMSVASIDEPGKLADTIITHLTVKLEEKQKLLETMDPVKRLEKLYTLLEGEIEILEVEQRLRQRVKKQMEKTQKEYYLSEQMKAIQKELGEKDEFKSEIQEL